MKSFVINLPDNLDIKENDLKFKVAAQLYQEGKISLGEGALIAEVSKKFFIENLGSYNVSVFNYNPQELLEEIRNA